MHPVTESSPPSTASGFAAGYARDPAVSDEMVDADGSLRPHWRMFVSMLDDLGPDELLRRWGEARRLIHDNGITHNVYGDPDGLDRPWNLDFVPMLVPAAEWDTLAAALQQRARLIDLLIADLYGKQETIRSGALPPEIVWSNPQFLRPCHGIDLPNRRHLHLYGADVVRVAEGRFAVLSDRTQAPSGAGYTLENRIVMSRVLPSIFRQCNVQRLAPFFVALRQMLTNLAPMHPDNPRVVLLTPGPYNETYFEHAYLARYLGYTLVQGNDLTVRDAKVYLKTLSGLQRVDVILRRVDDDFCDPLELYAGSYLGVPGLTEAVREGNVAVANALGSGVLQGPVFLPFMHAACRQLLGEDLKIPCVATWWCGQKPAMDHVLANLKDLVIKPAFPARRTSPVFADTLSKTDLAALAERIRADPSAYVAQEHIRTATVPALEGDRVEPRRFVTRAYLAATTSGDYALMPGALTRITHDAASMDVSLQTGGGSKDTWVLADAPVSQISLLAPTTEPVELSRGGGALPSRIADDLYWLGRYVQRAEALVRFARATLNRLLDQSGVEGARCLPSLVSLSVGKEVEFESGSIDHEWVEHLIHDDRTDGLRSTVANVQRIAGLLRDRISLDAWRILQSVEREVEAFEIDLEEPTARVGDLLDRLIVHFAAFAGLTTDSMTRGQAWQFLDMGHRVERALSTIELFRHLMIDITTNDSPALEAVLEIADSALTYRRRYLTHLEAHAVADLLLCDESNPRSLAFQAAAIETHLYELPYEGSHPNQRPHQQRVKRLRALLQLVDIEEMCHAVEDRRAWLDGLLAEAGDHLMHLSESISQFYFAHAPAPRRLRAPGEEALS
jgi:uncharacterized circularly permuted ATP-grasp superfamily protein/uncharacterized alpha-E superfamily protein